MVPCRRYRNQGWLGFQLVCEHKRVVHRYRSHLLGTHKVGWEHGNLGQESLRSGDFWHRNRGIAIHVGFQYGWRILEVIVVNIRTLRNGIDGICQLRAYHGARRGWGLDVGLKGVGDHDPLRTDRSRGGYGEGYRGGGARDTQSWGDGGAGDLGVVLCGYLLLFQ